MSQKGGAYERELCRQLSAWWLGDKLRKDELVFWRSAGSGGWSKRRGRVGKHAKLHQGDIAAIDHRGRKLTELLTIEIKRGYSKNTFADVVDWLPASEGRLAQQAWEGWLQEVIESHEQAGTRSWLLIQRRDRRSAIVFMPLYFFSALDRLTDAFVPPHPSPLCKLHAPICFRYVKSKKVVQLKSGKKRVKFKYRYAHRDFRLVVMRLSDFLACVSPGHIRTLHKDWR